MKLPKHTKLWIEGDLTIIKYKRKGGRGRDPGLTTQASLPLPVYIYIPLLYIFRAGDENAGSKKKRQICARRRYEVEVRVRSIERNGANLKEKRLI